MGFNAAHPANFNPTPAQATTSLASAAPAPQANPQPVAQAQPAPAQAPAQQQPAPAAAKATDQGDGQLPPLADPRAQPLAEPTDPRAQPLPEPDGAPAAKPPMADAAPYQSTDQAEEAKKLMQVTPEEWKMYQEQDKHAGVIEGLINKNAGADPINNVPTGAVEMKQDQTSTFGPSKKAGGWDDYSDRDTDAGDGAYGKLIDGVSAAVGVNKAKALGVSPGDQIRLTDAQGNTKIVRYDDKVAKYPDRIDLYGKNGPVNFSAVKAEKLRSTASTLYPNQKLTT